MIVVNPFYPIIHRTVLRWHQQKSRLCAQVSAKHIGLQTSNGYALSRPGAGLGVGQGMSVGLGVGQGLSMGQGVDLSLGWVWVWVRD